MVNVTTMGLSRGNTICQMARHRNRLNRALYLLFLVAMAIPFEACMIPVMRVTNLFHLNGSLTGMGICYWGHQNHYESR